MQNPYDAIAEYYDLEHDQFEDDIAFYLNVFQEGPILEVGAGTGRITAALARAGLDAWGVEPSGAMLERARIRVRDLPSAHLVHGTLGDLSDAPAFSAVLFGLNTLWHFIDTEDQLAALHGARARLRPTGLLVVDVSNPLALADRGGKGDLRVRFVAEYEGDAVTCWSAAWDDEAEQLLSLSLSYDRTDAGGCVRRVSASLELRYLYRRELEILLRAAGFRLLNLYGSYDLDPYDMNSRSILAIATPS